jgi:hypothetical protein
MPLFDPWTKNVLMEALESPLFEEDSSTWAPSTKNYGPGGAGVGVCGAYDDVLPLEASPEQILFGAHDETPSGTNIYSQATWSNYKGIVDSTIDSLGFSGANIQIGPVVLQPGALLAAPMRGLKQLIKLELAQRYLGAPSSAGKGYAEIHKIMPENSKYTPDDIKKWVDDNVKSKLNNFKENSTPGRFGWFGQKLAEKMPELAAMGYDPLDFATKMMGADSAARAFEDLAYNPRKSALGAGGYLSSGMRKGIY